MSTQQKQTSNQPHIYLIAGEVSGDILGARLMAALKSEDSQQDFCFSGIGGAAMQENGLASLFPMHELSIMGIAEILPRLPKILRRMKQTVRDIIEKQPDIIITIDAPDFGNRVVRKLHAYWDKHDIPAKKRPKLVHYVAPTVWAWRPERAEKLAKLYDGIMCLFPMEPAYFEAAGLDAAFVGHSALESYQKGRSRDQSKALRKELGIPENALVLGVLFGSRMGELHRVGPILRQAAYQYAHQYNKNKTAPPLCLLSPTLPHLKKEVRNLMESMPVPVHIIDDASQKWAAFGAMDYALATSGTVGLELAIADVPHIIGYCTSPFTAAIVKRKIKVRFAHLANIMLDRQIVPEFIQQQCQPDNLLAALNELQQDAPAQREAFAEIRAMIGGAEPSQPPSLQAAQYISSFLR